jgi:putative acetyltransferase
MIQVRMDWNVRSATAEDSPGVAEVVRRVFEEYGFTWETDGYHSDLYDLRAGYFDLGHGFYVADSERGIVGTIALKLFPTLPGEPGKPIEVAGKQRVGGADCSLDRLYVDSTARKLGIGWALGQRVVEEARQRGRRMMEIWSDKRFEDAHRLYERLGARAVGERVLDDPDQSPEWGLALTL